MNGSSATLIQATQEIGLGSRWDEDKENYAGH